MKRYILLLLLGIVFTQSTALQAADRSDTTVYKYKIQKPEPYHARVSQVIMHILSRRHYKHMEIGDSLSSNLFDRYIQTLDFHRSIFLKSDIGSFEKYRYELDDALKAGNLKTAYKVFNKFQDRFKERQLYIKKRLKHEFDYTIEEDYRPDRSHQPWAETPAQLDSIWRKRLKNEALQLKLGKKEWPAISELLIKRYTSIEKNIKQSESEDVFQWYMDTFAESYDPHTTYMSPKTSDDFSIRMSLSLEGIGASLRTENDYTKVVRIIAGGPASKSGLLHANDLITAVGQGDDGEMVDVVGWRIDDVVQLIRGPKSTKVRLKIIEAEASLDDPQKTIKIVRDKVNLEDSAAKSDTLEIEYSGRKYKLGVIQIPTFYFGYEDMRKGNPVYKSTTRDVRRIIGELQSAGVDGIIIDLRNNGGGFLNEAIDLTGLFIDNGPVVQVRDMRGRLKIEKDHNSGLVYHGPLAVLVNRLSASASEIFAAAIQDYGRGIVLGSQTFGKGTVQNIEKLGRYFPQSKEKLGQVKLTVAKFYRINGGSTQHVGVIPDISFPSRYKVMEIGESEQKNALLWDEIKAARYNSYNGKLTANIPRLRAQHGARTNKNQEFKYLIEDIDEIKTRRAQKVISLNEDKRRLERKAADAKKEARKNEREENGRKKEDDAFLLESAHILADIIILDGNNIVETKQPLPEQ